MAKKNDPKSVKEAIEMGWKVKNIYSKGSKKCRIAFQPRYFNRDNTSSIVSFWITSKYLESKYPNIYANN